MFVSAEASVGNGLEVISKERDQRAGVGLAGRRSSERHLHLFQRSTRQGSQSGVEGKVQKVTRSQRALGGLFSVSSEAKV